MIGFVLTLAAIAIVVIVGWWQWRQKAAGLSRERRGYIADNRYGHAIVGGSKVAARSRRRSAFDWIYVIASRFLHCLDFRNSLQTLDIQTIDPS
ncbi:hypothetical protein ACU4GH_38605 [Bradyrhizobium betae]